MLLGCGAEARDAAEGPRRVLPVTALRVHHTDHYTTREHFAGRVTARRQSDLGFDRGGLLHRVLVDEGDRVAAGQLLAALDTRLLHVERRRLAAQIERVEAELNLARVTAARRRELHGKEHLSSQRLDEAHYAERARAAELAATRAARDRVEVQLALSRIEAPYAGTVSARRADEGAVVAAGQPILELIEDRVLEIHVGLPAASAERLRPGTPHTIAVGGVDIATQLYAVIPSVETDTRTVKAIFRIPDPPPQLRDGELARFTLPADIAAAGFWLPLGALAESERGLWAAYALVPAAADGDDAVAAPGQTPHRVERRKLEVLYSEADRVFARGTLRDGELAAAAGIHRLVPGQLVRIASAQPATAQADRTDAVEPAPN